MLSEADEHLITAAVDGELSAEQDRAFRALLAKTGDAVRLFQALQRDRARLAALPRSMAPKRLHADVLARIKPATSSECQQQVRPRRGLFTPVATAASFMLAVGAGAYWLAADRQAQPSVARQLQHLPNADVALAPRPDHANPPQPGGDEWPGAGGDTEPPPPAAPTPAAVAVQDPPKEPLPQPESNPQDIHAAPTFGSEVKAFARVDVKLPLLVSFPDLAHEESQTTLHDRLAHDPATRIDLFAKDTAKAVEALTLAGAAVKLNLVVETIAAERMKRKMPSTWAVFTDALTATEATKWLATAAEAEAKAESPSAKTFLAAHVLSAAAHDQKEAQLLAGFDLGLGKKPAEPSAHIAAKTIDQVTSAMQKGDATKPAILVTYLPPAARVYPSLSKDIRQYHELRKDRKPGTVPVMVVIRQSNG